ncbi:MAG: DUF1572 family protein [Gemmatimonadetes bacterium]|nr:DUF1572 family protein [Gemmatimonadota bacterium]
MTRTLVASIEGEYRRYKALAEGAMDQLDEAQLSEPGPSQGNSIATICWHVAGNLRSRFTDFLTTDGEKPWRAREEEFAARRVTRAELREKWEGGWAELLGALGALDDTALSRTVTIRQQPLAVHEALFRSLSHVSYHVGQIVYLAHALRGPSWRYLTIPPGGTDAYNKAPTHEKPGAYVEAAKTRPDGA